MSYINIRKQIVHPTTLKLHSHSISITHRNRRERQKDGKLLEERYNRGGGRGRDNRGRGGGRGRYNRGGGEREG